MPRMSFLKKLWIPVLALVAGAQAISINDTPLGWASQNGGTTGGAGGEVKVVTTLGDFQTWAKASGKYIIYVSGTMGANLPGSTNPDALSKVEVTSDKTIFGLPGATFYGCINIKSAKNVIVRNLKVIGPGSVDVDGVDPVWVDQSTNVWIDHMDIADGQDGNLDITNGSNYVTVSYTKFTYTSRSSIHQFSNLFGNSDSKTTDRTKLKITVHHSWWADGVKERMPRVRFGQVHIVNNLFTSKQGEYCVRAGVEADILVEANAFLGVKNPIDLYEGNYTAVTAKDNYFDAAVTGNKLGNKTAFTPPYTMTKDVATAVEAKVKGTLGAGATLCDVRSSNCGSTPSSSSVAPSSSSVVPSSSSVKPSSSSVVPSSSSSIITPSSSSAIGTNQAPVITSTGIPKVNENIAITEVAYQTVASDPENKPLTYSLSGGDDAGLFTINASSGALYFKVSPDFEKPTDVGANNTYKANISVSDGVLSATKSITLTVQDVADSPVSIVTKPGMLQNLRDRTLFNLLGRKVD